MSKRLSSTQVEINRLNAESNHLREENNTLQTNLLNISLTTRQRDAMQVRLKNNNTRIQSLKEKIMKLGKERPVQKRRIGK